MHNMSRYRLGNKGQSSNVPCAWALQGLVVVNVNYRLLPWVSMPTPVQDVAAAVAWTQVLLTAT